MKKLIVSEWMSLDGVFDADTMGTWWTPYDSDDRRAYVQETIAMAGGFVLGKTTYEMLAQYWSAKTNNEEGVADKLNSAPKYVVSSTLKKGHWNNSTIIEANVVEAITELKQQPGKDLLVMGSAMLVHSLMLEDLIDEYWFLVQPIMTGKGRQLFKGVGAPCQLELVKATTLSRGVLALCYQSARK